MAGHSKWANIKHRKARQDSKRSKIWSKCARAIIVAAKNFGCGSSREHAPIALGAAGVEAVVAESYARIFFRNAINVGLPVMEVGDLEAEDGDEIEIDLKQGSVRNLTKGTTHHAAPMPQVMIDVLDEGGLVAYLKKNGTYDESSL